MREAAFLIGAHMSYVPPMVDGIMEHVAREALRGESRVVAAIAGPLPLHTSHLGEGLDLSTLGVDEFGAYR